jgi:hypothetical protein
VAAPASCAHRAEDNRGRGRRGRATDERKSVRKSEFEGSDVVWR